MKMQVKKCVNALGSMESINMGNQQVNTYFWIQKKNERDENMVVVNGVFSSFKELPHSIRFFKPTGEFFDEKTSKTKISIQRMYRKNQVECLICVSGWIDEKDASNRNIAYSFYYVTPEIDANVLIGVKDCLKNCLNLTKSLEFFDEKDFNECFSRVDPQKCQNEMKNIWTRRYEGRGGIKKMLKDMCNDPVGLVEKLSALVGLVVGAGVLAYKKRKRNEVNHD